MHIVVHIHNSSLGSVILVGSFEEGVERVIALSEAQLGRHLTDEEHEVVSNAGEYYNDDDADNVWCYSVGIVE